MDALTWVNKDVSYMPPDNTILNKIKKTLIGNIKPSQDPQILFFCGLPGSGKSTISEYIKKNNKEYNNHIFIDFDEFYKFHPEYINKMKIKDVNGNITNIGFSDTWNNMMNQMSYIIRTFISYIIENKYNIIINHVLFKIANLSIIYELIFNKYRISLYYISTKIPLTINRVKKRSIKTGKFIYKDFNNIEEKHKHFLEALVKNIGIISQFCKELVVLSGNHERIELNLERKLIFNPLNKTYGKTAVERAYTIRRILYILNV